MATGILEQIQGELRGLREEVRELRGMLAKSEGAHGAYLTRKAIEGKYGISKTHFEDLLLEMSAAGYPVDVIQRTAGGVRHFNAAQFHEGYKKISQLNQGEVA